MDNVLIDDRRALLLSQSVAKLHKQWEDKRRGVNKDRLRDRDRDYRDRDRDYRSRERL